MELEEITGYDWAYRIKHGQFNPAEVARRQDPEAWFEGG